MFQKKDQEESGRTILKGATIIAAGTSFRGDIECTNDLRIDGHVCGNIKSGSKVVVGADGRVEGNIEGVQADVMGQITGNIAVSELLNLRGKACMMGDIYTRSLNMEGGVTFNGRCHMGAEASEMVKPEEKKLKPEIQKLAVAN
jgi:cytoskeletal protein CcmA (bactofilin family)